MVGCGWDYREEWGRREGNVNVAGRREMLVAKGTRGQGGRLLVLFSFVNEKYWCPLVLEVRGMGWNARKKPM